MAGTVQAHLANFFPRIRRSYCVQILGQNRLNFWPKIEKWATVGDHRFFAGPIGSRKKAKCRVPGLCAKHVTILPRSGLAYGPRRGPLREYVISQ